MAVRKYYLDRALASYASLRAVVDELREEEVLAALDLEAATSRRRSMVDRLISRAIRLNELAYAKTLKAKYHHGNEKSSPVQSRDQDQEG